MPAGTSTARPAVAISAAALARVAARAAAADRGERDLAADVAELADCGLVAAPIPTACGGSGLGTEPSGTTAALDLLRTLGRANLSLARLYEGHVNAIKLIALYAVDPARTLAFEAARAGCLFGVWGADGAAPVTIETCGEEQVLAGQKRFASGLGVLDFAILTARTSEGVQLVLVPAGDPHRSDTAAWTASGMRATQSGTYRLDGLAVGADASFIGHHGDLFREPHFEGGVWRYCAAHLGGAEALYEELLAQLAARGQSDAPLQAVRIADAALMCETARLWINPLR